MPILNYTTTIKADRSLAQIQRMLVQARASKVAAEYEDGWPIGMAFELKTISGVHQFSMPCRWRQVQAVLVKQRVEPRYRSDQHSLNVAWRILKDWTEAQLAIVQAGLVTADEVFLPYMLVGQNQTVYDGFAHNRLEAK